MKAYALNRIERKSGAVPAKTVFDTTQEEFDSLEALGAVRKASKEEIAVAKDSAQRSGQSFTDETTLVGGDSASQLAQPTPPPSSGAKGDPAAKPKAATSSKSDSKDDDLKV